MVLFLTLEVVPKLTLERLKSGTETNSPAYIYIYIERERESALVWESFTERMEGGGHWGQRGKDSTLL